MTAGDGSAAAYVELMRLSVGTAALASLAQLGVVEALCEAPRSSGELAASLHLHEPALVRGLHVAAAMGVLSRAGDRWQISTSLVEAGERGPLGIAEVAGLLRSLPEHLRSGATQSRDREELTERYRHVTPGLSRLFEGWARRLAERLDRPLRSILDVGAGAGVWSLQMARLQPDCRVTGLDLGPVLGGFSDAANRLQVKHVTIDGDYHRVEVPEPHDRVVLANVLHLEEPDAARSLVRRAAGWVRPGGDLVIIDMMVRTDETALDIAVYELHLALRVPGGRVYSADKIESWCADAGLARCTLHVLDEGAGGAALVGERRA